MCVCVFFFFLTFIFKLCVNFVLCHYLMDDFHGWMESYLNLNMLNANRCKSKLSADIKAI